MTYQIWFKDSLGWYCPGELWTNPDAKLLQEWQQEIKKYNRKDVVIKSIVEESND